MRKKMIIAAVLIIALLGAVAVWRFLITDDFEGGAWNEDPALFNDIPRKGTVTMVDLGADSCIPCKMMAPIMEKLEKKYRGRADIIFIDVYKYPEQAKRFNVRAIPTQIFFDKEGKEVYRHEGFMGEADIDRIFHKTGVS